MSLSFCILRFIGQACPADFCTSCASDCQDYQDRGHTKSGVYHVIPVGTRSGFDVYCDMTTDDGGWLVIVEPGHDPTNSGMCAQRRLRSEFSMFKWR